MPIKTIPLSRLEANLRQTLSECADSGDAIVVQLPDDRLVAIQSLKGDEDDSLVEDLLQSNPEFQELVKKSRDSERKPFIPGGAA
jgi:hypothetical protein